MGGDVGGLIPIGWIIRNTAFRCVVGSIICDGWVWHCNNCFDSNRLRLLLLFRDVTCMCVYVCVCLCARYVQLEDGLTIDVGLIERDIYE